MLTAFGKYVRVLRIENGCLLKDMADYLGVTSSYLSAVEMGKRKIPQDWESKIALFFSLDMSQQNSLRKSIQDSLDEVPFNLTNASAEQRELAFAFARKMDRLDDNEIQAMLNVFKEKDKEYKA
ncbi:MAG: helix-turn-helix domain-containing protein [Eubacteriaceae bacterium]|nr:helix-turn-helix domain-containing protein [Eubacteriaceae bacterium]